MVSSILLHATRVDDSDRGRQGPFISFWGVQEEEGLLMANYITAIKNEIQSRAPPSSASELDFQQIFCVLINNEWKRARVSEPTLSSIGTLDAFCVDSGESHSIPLSFVRTVDMAGIAADHIRQTPPLAKKFIIADAVGPGSGSQWSIPALFFLRDRLENRAWKAVPLDNDTEPQIVRIFDSSNQLFVTSLIQEELCLPSQTYQEALRMSKVLNDDAHIEPVPEPAESTYQDPSSPPKTAHFFSLDTGNCHVKCDTSPPQLLNPVEIVDGNSVDASLEDSSVYFSSPEVKRPSECLSSSPVSVSSSCDTNPDSVQQNVSISIPESANEETGSSVGHSSSSPGSPQPPSPVVEPLPLEVADNLPAEYLPPVADRNPCVANLLKILLRSPRQTELVPTPSSLKIELMPHQKWGLSWMLWRESETPSGGCFSHSGFDKYLCIVALLLRDKENRAAQAQSEIISPWPGLQHSRATLILCPKDAMDTCQDQVSSSSESNSLTVVSYYGQEKYAVSKKKRPAYKKTLKTLHEFDVIIAAYETVREEIPVSNTDPDTTPITDFDPNVDCEAVQKSLLLRIGFNRIILDYGEIIQDSSTKVSQAVCRITAVHRWVVSATPFRHFDWFPVFRFLRVQPFNDLQVLNSWLKEERKERLKLLVGTLNLTRIPVFPDNRLEFYSPDLL